MKKDCMPAARLNRSVNDTFMRDIIQPTCCKQILPPSRSRVGVARHRCHCYHCQLEVDWVQGFHCRYRFARESSVELQQDRQRCLGWAAKVVGVVEDSCFGLAGVVSG